MKRGLVVGKFYPPHKGHAYLIDYALEHCDQLTVMVCDSPDYKVSADARGRWIAATHPQARVVIIPDIGKDDDSEAWAAHTIEYLGFQPDVVFSSEDYGDSYAHYLGAEHVKVDKARTTVPVCATRIRTNLLKEWKYLGDQVRADMAVRIVVVGAESTGTTTLARALAERLGAPWVPEYGRTYSEGFLTTAHEWKDDEFRFIAQTQQTMERRVAMRSHGVIVCDTNAFATSLWQERYMGATTADVQAIADSDVADLYILTGDEIPFVQDGTRDGEHIRHDMHRRFEEELARLNVPSITVRGDLNTRLDMAMHEIDALLGHVFPTLTRRLQHAV